MEFVQSSKTELAKECQRRELDSRGLGWELLARLVQDDMHQRAVRPTQWTSATDPAGNERRKEIDAAAAFNKKARFLIRDVEIEHLAASITSATNLRDQDGKDVDKQQEQEQRDLERELEQLRLVAADSAPAEVEPEALIEPVDNTPVTLHYERRCDNYGKTPHYNVDLGRELAYVSYSNEEKAAIDNYGEWVTVKTSELPVVKRDEASKKRSFSAISDDNAEDDEDMEYTHYSLGTLMVKVGRLREYLSMSGKIQTKKYPNSPSGWKDLREHLQRPYSKHSNVMRRKAGKAISSATKDRITATYNENLRRRIMLTGSRTTKLVEKNKPYLFIAASNLKLNKEYLVTLKQWFEVSLEEDYDAGMLGIEVTGDHAGYFIEVEKAANDDEHEEILKDMLKSTVGRRFEGQFLVVELFSGDGKKIE